MKMRKTVYISGPLTNGGGYRNQAIIDANVRVAMAAANDLINAGFSPLCPHLTQFQQEFHPQDHDVWMEVDRPWVLMADMVYRLPGKSKGGDLECLWAIDASIPVYTDFKTLVKVEGQCTQQA